MSTKRELRMLDLLSRMHSLLLVRRMSFHDRVIHKAVSAEAILRHCLRKRGWTTAFKAGTLSEADHVDLLKDIAAYCRAWLGHEARQFSRAYLNGEDVPAAAAISNTPPQAAVSSSGRSLLSETRAFDSFAANARRFFGRVRQFIREGIVAAALGLLGPSPLTSEELNESEVEVARQEEYLSRFEQEVISGPPMPMSEGEFVARVTSYGDSIYGAGQNVGRRTARSMGPDERRVLGEPRTEHCEDCPQLAEMGWQPAGTLPAIGETTCRNNCYCHFVYRFQEGGPEFTRLRPGVYNPTK